MKRLSIIFLGILTLFIGLDKVSAGGSISVNATSIYLGNSVTVSVTVTEAAAWEVHIGVSGAASPSNCTGLDFADSSSDAKNTARTYTTTCTPTKIGTINFSLSGNVTSETGGTVNLSGSRSVSVINKPVYTPPVQNNTPKPVTPKSSINYLSSLEVEGSILNPVFNKETLEYTVELESGTTLINIKATAQDSKANISGLGAKGVSEGANNFEIVVTAENGSKRTYKINAIVKEKDPIIVNIDNETYTVVRKREQLISSSAYYSESSVEINGEEIPAYYGEVTGYTLVGLKNSEGIINLYIYDKKDNSYKLYQEFNFSKIIFYPLEPSIIPDGYSKDKIIIKDIEIPCYKSAEFVLLYGLNVENNNKGFYVYDSFENTLQRYNDKIFDSYIEEIEILKSIIVGLLSIVIVVVLVSALQGSINAKNNKKSKSFFKSKEEKTNSEKDKEKQRKLEAKMLEKELKRKEKEEKKKKKRKKNLDDTNVIDITNINIKKKGEISK